MRRPGSPYLVAISLLVLAAFATRAISLDTQSLWRDEVDALRFATAPWAEMLSNFVRPGWNGPLYFLLLRGWVAFAGTSEYAMRFFSLAFGVLCVPLAYALGRALFSRHIGLLAALLVTTSPYLTWYGQEVKMYTLVPTLVLVAVYAQKRGMSRTAGGKDWHWWIAQIIATSLALYTHVLAALLIPVQVLLYLAWWPRTRRQWVGALVCLGCVTLPYLPLVIWQAPLIWQTRETGFYPYTLGEMTQILLNGWSLGILGWGQPWGTLLMSTLAIWGLISPLFLPWEGTPAEDLQQPPSQDAGLSGTTPSSGQLTSSARMVKLENRIALLCWLATPLLIIWLISTRSPLFTDRYLVWTAPAFYLLVALGLASFRHFGDAGRWVTVFLVCVILILNGANQWQQASVSIKSDFRAAAAYVADYHASHETTAPQLTDEPPATTTKPSGRYAFRSYLPLISATGPAFDDLIVFQIPHGRYTFDYYFPEEAYPWTEGLYTNHRAPDGSYFMGEQEAAYRMQEMTARHDTMWLIATETEMWDERGLVQAWLEANTHRVDEAHFMRVDVYRYVR